jgi:hypothetical protein
LFKVYVKVKNIIMELMKKKDKSSPSQRYSKDFSDKAQSGEFM